MRYDYFSDNRESSLTPKVNARFKATDDISLRASYGMGFRSPSLKEKYYNSMEASDIDKYITRAAAAK